MRPTAFKQDHARILIVEDNEENAILLRELLGYSGFRRVDTILDSRRAAEQILESPPDLVVLDLHMPVVSGFDILEELQSRLPPEAFLPVLVFTADWTETTRKKALGLGAWDFITKPFDSTELLLRIRNFLRMRQMHVELENQNKNLEAIVARRTRRVNRARAEAIEVLARASEYRDDATGQHALRVGEMSARIAIELGLNASAADLIRMAAPLHDVGKIGISDSILLKPGKLTPDEFRNMQDHPELGANIIGKVKSPLLRKAREIALFHHENWDGTGYPHGIAGTKIPLAARIVAVADTFDALTHERPYKAAWPLNLAIEEVERLSGSRFDPEIVAALLKVCATSFALVDAGDQTLTSLTG